MAFFDDHRDTLIRAAAKHSRGSSGYPSNAITFNRFHIATMRWSLAT
jgi:hypothetical protein